MPKHYVEHLKISINHQEQEAIIADSNDGLNWKYTPPIPIQAGDLLEITFKILGPEGDHA